MRIKTAIIGALLACLLAAPAAGAASSDPILRDCADGQIDGNYTRKELERARDKIPGDLDAYSDCRGALDGARIDTSAGKRSGDSGGSSGGAGGAGGSGTGSSTPPGSTGSNAGNAESADPQSPAEAAAVKAATGSKGSSAVRLGPGPAIAPGATGIPKDSDLRRPIPDPLLVVLILLGTVALVGAVLATRARVFTRRLG